MVYKRTLCFKVIAVRSNFACLHNFDIQMQIVMLMAFDEYYYCFVHVVLKHDEKFSVCPQNSFVTVSRITKVTQAKVFCTRYIYTRHVFQPNQDLACKSLQGYYCEGSPPRIGRFSKADLKVIISVLRFNWDGRRRRGMSGSFRYF